MPGCSGHTGSVSAVIVGFNSAPYLQGCIDSLQAQTLALTEIIFVDNDSGDNSVALVRSRYPAVHVLSSDHNGGFGSGANIGIHHSIGEYILILNPDMVLDSDFLESALHPFDYVPHLAAVSGKIMSNQSPKIIDTTGLHCTRTRRVLDRGCGLEDHGQFESAGEVFGVSGNCMLLSTHALRDAAIDGEVFDQDYFMSKEDVDLCWRLRLRGWSIWFTPQAVGYHVRGTGIVDRTSFSGALRGRSGLSRFQRYYSWRNHRLLLLKNSQPRGLFKDGLWLLVGEARSLAWLLFVEPYNLGALISTAKAVPSALRRRRTIMRGSRVVPGTVEVWFE